MATAPFLSGALAGTKHTSHKVLLGLTVKTDEAHHWQIDVGERRSAGLERRYVHFSFGNRVARQGPVPQNHETV